MAVISKCLGKKVKLITKIDLCSCERKGKGEYKALCYFCLGTIMLHILNLFTSFLEIQHQMLLCYVRLERNNMARWNV